MAVQVRSGELVVGNLVAKNMVPNLRAHLLTDASSSAGILDMGADDSVTDMDDLLPCVCAVPSHYDGPPLDRLRLILQHAGYRVMDFVPESVAAALSLPKEDVGTPPVKHLAVFDMGGIETTCSILHCDADMTSPTILSTSGVAVSANIVEHLAGAFQKKHGIDLRVDSLAMERLTQSADAAKHELSSAAFSQVLLPFITADASGAKHLEHTITSSALHRLMETPLEHAATLCREALRRAKLDAVDAVVVVGGGGKSPLVQASVGHALDNPRLLVIENAEEAVALGAATRGVALAEFTTLR
ncbi:hypothetical protein DYB36_000633 [Aphanomyces astaci]|uniref:Uncharacterized protein n=1 Tax=Aphanomyces astaci TaxID=112090 RepID=A0A397BC66_APHAT|nr:hypothetical protein DYB36_000633 [Aphanomyces astaci]